MSKQTDQFDAEIAIQLRRWIELSDEANVLKQSSMLRAIEVRLNDCVQAEAKVATLRTELAKLREELTEWDERGFVADPDLVDQLKKIDPDTMPKWKSKGGLD